MERLFKFGGIKLKRKKKIHKSSFLGELKKKIELNKSSKLFLFQKRQSTYKRMSEEKSLYNASEVVDWEPTYSLIQLARSHDAKTYPKINPLHNSFIPASTLRLLRSLNEMLRKLNLSVSFDLIGAFTTSSAKGRSNCKLRKLGFGISQTDQIKFSSEYNMALKPE